MPEYLRALVVILLLATFTFAFAKKAIGPLISPQLFHCWRNAWFAVTLIAFLSYNFWIFIIVSTIFLLFTVRREQNQFALFLILLFAVPRIRADIPGFGVIDTLFSIHYLRLLSLTILFPAFLALRSKPSTLRFGKNWPDRLLLIYLILTFLLELRETSFTDTLRLGFYEFTDIFLPYYVASRGIKDFNQLKEVMIAFVLACFVVGVIGVFEFSQSWLLYNSLRDALGVSWESGVYLARGDYLRAVASLGQPIVFGFAMMVGLGFYLFITQSIKKRMIRRLGLALIIAGLFSSLSKGPWIGAIILVVVFLATRPNVTKYFAILSIVALLALGMMQSIPGVEKIIKLLPLIGNTDTENIDYRSELIDKSMILINKNPFFGAANIRSTPEMKEMIQGEGIVDIVNTYLEIALRYGLVGLSLFAGFFLLILLNIYKSMRRIADNKSEVYLCGRSLIASLIGILITISTVSSIILIPYIYWSVAGLMISYSRILRSQESIFDLQNLEQPVLPTSLIRNKIPHS